jgi:hypothetical protein
LNLLLKLWLAGAVEDHLRLAKVRRDLGGVLRGSAILLFHLYFTHR